MRYTINMSKYVSIGEAAKSLGVSTQTLRRWDLDGKLVAERTPGGRRRYRVSDVAQFNPLSVNRVVLERPTVAYVRVSSSDQKDGLDRQIKALETYCAEHGLEVITLTDLLIDGVHKVVTDVQGA